MKNIRLAQVIRLAVSITFVSFVCMASVSHAAPIRWHSRVVHVTAEGKDLKDVLRDFTASQGVPATISSDVHGTVTGHFDTSPQRFLDALASSFGFVWFYDGNVLSISDANSATRQLIHLDHASVDDLRNALARLHVSSPHFPISYDDSQRAALVSGPPPYVQLVAEIARRLDQEAAQRNGSSIRIFALHHAWATDHNVEIDGKNIVVPGVATVLSRMYHPDSLGTGAGQGAAVGYDARAGATQPDMRRMVPMQDVAGGTNGGGLEGGLNPPLPASMAGNTPPGEGLAGLLHGMAAGGGQASGMPALRSSYADNGSSGAVPVTGGGDSLPVIEADPRTNSVLIRDLPQRLSQYDDLIARLDVRPKMVEIEAHIIEIDDNALRQIGVDWRAHNSHIDLQTGNGGFQQNSYNGTLNPVFGDETLPQSNTTVINTSPVGASLTAVLGNAGRYLLARVNALHQDNLARIDASPKVATLDNVEAVMNNKTRFFVRVSGYTSADLYSVSTGVSLRVLPMVVEENGRQEIKLKVHIEDGSLTGQQVDNIPIITTSTINTESFVGQGESLLIAGYRVDNSSNGETGVPGLSKIPLIGALFRYRSHERSHMERLFLLSPRIITF